MKGKLDLTIVVPECDCAKKYKGPKLHRPGCARLQAIREKYGAA